MALATLTPDSDITVASWTTTPLFSKVNEDIDTPDGTTIVNTNRNQNAVLGQDDSPADVGEVTEVILRLRASGTPDNLHNLRLELMSSDLVTTFATFETGLVLTSVLADFSDTTAVSMTKVQIDDTVFRFKTLDPGMVNPGDWKIDTINNDITYSVAAAPDEEIAGTHGKGQQYPVLEPDEVVGY